MYWTTDIPAIKGWYWVRQPHQPHLGRLVFVRAVKRRGAEIILPSLEPQATNSHEIWSEDVASGYHWAGPLDPPLYKPAEVKRVGTARRFWAWLGGEEAENVV